MASRQSPARNGKSANSSTKQKQAEDTAPLVRMDSQRQSTTGPVYSPTSVSSGHTSRSNNINKDVVETSGDTFTNPRGVVTSEPLSNSKTLSSLSSSSSAQQGRKKCAKSPPGSESVQPDRACPHSREQCVTPTTSENSHLITITPDAKRKPVKNKVGKKPKPEGAAPVSPTAGKTERKDGAKTAVTTEPRAELPPVMSIPQTNLAIGLLVTCCFNLPFGIAAMYFSLRAAAAYRDGYKERGASRARLSIILSLIGIMLTMCIVSSVVVYISRNKHSKNNKYNEEANH